MTGEVTNGFIRAPDEYPDEQMGTELAVPLAPEVTTETLPAYIDQKLAELTAAEVANPNAAERLAVAAGIIKFMTEPRAYDQLPKGLVYTKIVTPGSDTVLPEVCIDLDPRLSCWERDLDSEIQAAVTRLLPQGEDHGGRKSLLVGSEAWRASARQALDSSPEVLLARSFLETAPNHEDRPLSVNEKLAMATAITAAAREKYAEAPEMAGKQAARKTSQLDDERWPGADATNGASPAVRAKAFYDTLLMQTAQEVTGIADQDEALEEYRRKARWQTHLDAAMQISHKLFGSESGRALSSGAVFTGRLISELHDDYFHGFDLNLEQCIEAALHRTVDAIVDCRTAYDLMCVGGKNSFRRNMTAIADVLQPKGDFIAVTEYDLLRKKVNQGEATAYLVDEYELAEAGKENIAEIRFNNKQVPTEGRIFTFVGTDEALPLQATHDVTITLADTPENVRPHIPGYTFAGRQGNVFGFNYSVDTHDPYQECPVEVATDERLPNVARRYADIGMHGLAKLLVSGSVSTLSDVERAVLQHSTYVIPLFRQGTKHDAYWDIGDFKEHVTLDGELGTQCTVSERFINVLVNNLVDPYKTPISIVPIHGYRLVEGLRTAIGHAQTVVTHQGKQYILDATPGRNQATGAHANASGDLTTSPTPGIRRSYLPRIFRRQTTNSSGSINPTKPVKPTTPATTSLSVAREVKKAKLPEAVPLKQPVDTITSIADTLFTQLGVALDVSLGGTQDGHERLLVKSLELSRDDPIRRAVELIRPIEMGYDPLSVKAIVTLQGYLAKYRAARQDGLLKSVEPKLEIYEDHVLTPIEVALEKLNKLAV